MVHAEVERILGVVVTPCHQITNCWLIHVHSQSDELEDDIEALVQPFVIGTVEIYSGEAVYDEL